MRDELVGYLLGALDEEQRARVETSLRADVRLREDMERMGRGLHVLTGAGDTPWVDPPDGLVERTCDFVFGQGGARAASPGSEAAGSAPTPSSEQRHGVPAGMELTCEPASGRTSWSVVDAFVVAGVCLTAALLFAPALITSRITAQRQLCASRLRELGQAFEIYSDQHQGNLPIVAASGSQAFAGVYAPILRDRGLLPDSQYLLCPEAVHSQQLPSELAMPTLSQIDQAAPNDWRLYSNTAGGNFAYALPYLNERGEHTTRKNLRRSNIAILGDVVHLPASGASAAREGRHGGQGANVLFQDGTVRYQHRLRVGADNLYQSDRGLVEVGQSVDDQVLAPSAVRP